MVRARFLTYQRGGILLYISIENTPMSRPSRNTDRQLIEAARKLVPKTGCTGLNLRQVADQAHVNLGMFHYHFKTKEAFTRQVLKAIYEDFFTNFSRETSELRHSNPLERLEAAVTTIGRFARDNRSLIVSLIQDVLNGEQNVTEFLGQLLARHFSILTEIIEDCQSRDLLPRVPLQQLVIQMMVAVNAPLIAITVIERAGVKKAMGCSLAELRDWMATDDAIRSRAHSVLSYLTQKKEGT